MGGGFIPEFVSIFFLLSLHFDSNLLSYWAKLTIFPSLIGLLTSLKTAMLLEHSIFTLSSGRAALNVTGFMSKLIVVWRRKHYDSGYWFFMADIGGGTINGVVVAVLYLFSLLWERISWIMRLQLLDWSWCVCLDSTGLPMTCYFAASCSEGANDYLSYLFLLNWIPVERLNWSKPGWIAIAELIWCRFSLEKLFFCQSLDSTDFVPLFLTKLIYFVRLASLREGRVLLTRKASWI